MYVCIISTLAHTKAAFADLKDGLVAYYPFNGNTNDESGNGNHGTIYGATSTTDRFGNTNKAYRFDGVNDYIEVPDSSTLRLSTLTLVAWVKLNSLADTGILYKRTGLPGTLGNDANYQMEIVTTDSNYYFSLAFYNSGWTDVYSSKTPILTGTWYHVAMTYESSNAKVYINGNLDANKTGLSGLVPGSQHLVIGAAWNTYLNGIIDSIRIYNRILSESEIQELYNEVGSTTPTPTATPTATLVQTPTPTATVTPTPTPSGTGIVFGYVNDEDENPLRSVTVKIDGDDYSDSSTTDEDGYYEFDKVPDGDYTITYSKTGYVTQTAEVTVADGDAVQAESVTMLVVQKGSIYGYVTDIRGNPLESVRLKLAGIGIKVKKTASTDSDGFFEFKDLEAGIYRIVAKKRFYKAAQQTVELEEGEDKEIEIEMKKTTKRGMLLEEGTK